MNQKQCVMFGAGGHAAVLFDSLGGRADVIVRWVLEREETSWGQTFCGVPVRGGDDLAAELRAEGATHFINGLGAVGDNTPRRRLFEFAIAQGLQPLSIIHPSAICSGNASLADGVQVLAAAVVGSGASLGQNVIINTGAIVEHDCRIEAHAHIATGARLGGGVIVHEGAHVGLGASIRQGIRIGRRAIVGMGAVVVKDVDDGVTVAGVPARVLQREML